MADRILTGGLKTGTGIGGVAYILLSGLAADDSPPVPSTVESIIIAIINQLKLISVSRGYATDINGNVSDWQFTDVPIEDLPNIEVRDPSVDVETRGQLFYNTLQVELIGRIATADINEARKLLTDMRVAMARGPSYPDEVYLSQLTDKPELLPEQKNKAVVMISMTYEVGYRTSFF
jgi:hypothetical protein